MKNDTLNVIAKNNTISFMQVTLKVFKKLNTVQNFILSFIHLNSIVEKCESYIPISTESYMKTL